MGLESASYISQLVTTNPTGSDAKSTADDHLRLLKSCLQSQFTSLGAAAVTVTAAELNASVATAAAAAAAAGATVFNAATAYTQYQAAISPLDKQTYRRNTAGTSATDPNLDSTNWTAITLNINAVTSINTGQLAGNRNAVINPSMAVSQAASVTLSASYQYGLADQWMIAVVGGTSISGSDANPTGYDTASGKMYGCTAGSWTTGQFYVQQRMPSKNTIRFNSKAVVASAKVYQNTGAARNFKIQIAKANSADNFSAQTVLQTSAAISVPSGSVTSISAAFAALGASDASNGLAIFIYDDSTNTVVSKTYLVSDVQLEVGTVATPVETRLNELSLCQDFYRRLGGTAASDLAIYGYVPGSALITEPFSFPAMAKTPSASVVGTWTVVNSSTQPSIYAVGNGCVTVQVTSNAGATTASLSGAATTGTSTYVQLDARL